MVKEDAPKCISSPRKLETMGLIYMKEEGYVQGNKIRRKKKKHKCIGIDDIKSSTVKARCTPEKKE